MLGKRFQRTTSMAQIGPPSSSKPTMIPEQQRPPAPSDTQPIGQWEILKQAEEMVMRMMAAAGGRATPDEAPTEAAQERPSGRGSKPVATVLQPFEFTPRATFLDSCFFCKRRLKHERDIYIYRSDAAFCTEECRQRQILKDERSMAAPQKSSPASEAAVAA